MLNAHLRNVDIFDIHIICYLFILSCAFDLNETSVVNSREFKLSSVYLENRNFFHEIRSDRLPKNLYNFHAESNACH